MADSCRPRARDPDRAGERTMIAKTEDRAWLLWKDCMNIADDRVAKCDAAAANFDLGSPDRAAENCAGIEARFISNAIRDLEPDAEKPPAKAGGGE